MGKLLISEVTKKVNRYINEYGLTEAHERIKREYRSYDELRQMMLLILYGKYAWYAFKDKEKLY